MCVQTLARLALTLVSHARTDEGWKSQRLQVPSDSSAGLATAAGDNAKRDDCRLNNLQFPEVV